MDQMSRELLGPNLYLAINNAFWFLYDHWYFVIVLVAVGFTKGQRSWFLRRDGNQCMFHYKKGNRWVRCKRRVKLQAHHIIPRGWASENMGEEFPLNAASNGIILCSKHHVNDGGELSQEFVVHPDNLSAQHSYQAGNKEAYKEMMDKRREKNLAGVPYWNTRWDWMFRRLVDKANSRHGAQYPNDKFPPNNRRGENGR